LLPPLAALPAQYGHPFRTISSNEHSGGMTIQYESIEVNLDIDDNFFILTPAES